MPGDTTRAWSSSSTKLLQFCYSGKYRCLLVYPGNFGSNDGGNSSGVLSGFCHQLRYRLDRPNIFRSGGAFICLRFIYLILAFRIRCPHCGFKFLKNPKGLGPVGFLSTTLTVLGSPVFNPWAVQIGRFLALKRFDASTVVKKFLDELVPD